MVRWRETVRVWVWREAIVRDDRSAMVVEHYSHGELLAAILWGLAAMGKSTDPIDSDDLAAGDEFHIGGRAATSALFSQLAWRPGARVLDVGCGIGGPARYLARHWEARVTGIDLTPEFVGVARELTRRCGLAGAVDFQVGSGLELPVPDGGVDAAYLLHVGMNVEDKSRLFAEVRRVLRPGGWFAVYDVMRVGPGEIDYPMPWASDARASFVAEPGTYRRLLAEAGLRIERERDRREFGTEFFSRMPASAHALPPLGPHIVMGPEFATKVSNLVKARRRGLLAPIEIISTAAESTSP
ncbi:MAG TPA: class I SAM-dependent methyltransferase [Pseudonocardiaceae bacterium]|nr:class I SAM-dependent methyltransferase [Pseudonocardiaceae bacterium]